MDRVLDSSGVAELGINSINCIGLSVIARSLVISKQAVRKWRRRGSIRDDRRDDIRRLLEVLPEQVSPVARVSDLDRRMPPAQQSAIGLSEWHGDCRTTETSREARDIDHRLFARLQKDVLR